MTSWFHSVVVATSLAACVAIGFASASIYSGVADHSAAKADRLPLVGNADVSYRTVETRSAGLSVLTRVPAAEATN